MRKPLAPVVFLLALAPAAWAASPAVPLDEQQQLKTIMGMLGADDLAYVPGHLPASYGMASTQTAAGEFTLIFTNAKYADGSAYANSAKVGYTELVRVIASAAHIS